MDSDAQNFMQAWFQQLYSCEHVLSSERLLLGLLQADKVVSSFPRKLGFEASIGGLASI